MRGEIERREQRREREGGREGEGDAVARTHLAHDLVVGIHLSAKSYRHAAIQSTKESSRRNKAVLTMRLGVAYLDLQEAFGYAIHLLNLRIQTSRIIAIRARSAPLELQHRCSREEDV